MAKPSNKIVLTDWPKYKYIEANYRGMETPELLDMLDKLFHFMIPCWSNEVVGGWIVGYNLEGIREELKFRKVEASDSGCNCPKDKKWT